MVVERVPRRHLIFVIDEDRELFLALKVLDLALRTARMLSEVVDHGLPHPLLGNDGWLQGDGIASAVLAQVVHHVDGVALMRLHELLRRLNEQSHGEIVNRPILALPKKIRILPRPDALRKGVEIGPRMSAAHVIDRQKPGFQRPPLCLRQRLPGMIGLLRGRFAGITDQRDAETRLE